MKSRHGFVSNSSSSSFLIVGIHNSINFTLDAMGWTRESGEYYDGWSEWEDSDYGQLEWKGYTIVGYDEPYYIGINAESRIKNGMTYKQIAAEFAKKMYDDFGVVLNASDIDLMYGESSSE